jgi:hypothetical protein
MSNLDEPDSSQIEIGAFHASQSMVCVAASLIRARLHLAPLEASRVSW